MVHNVEPLLQSLSRSQPSPRMMSSRVRLTLALGYFNYDAKDGGSMIYQGQNYGRYAAVDPFLRALVHQVLTRPCANSLLQVCGFRAVHFDDVEVLYQRAAGNGLFPEIRVLSGALTPRHTVNTGERVVEQRARAQKAERAFNASFADSDLVIYVGHSREGGGPDFAPPRLKNGRVDYSSYQKARVGSRLLMESLRSPQRKARALALLSCDTTEHFLNEVSQVGTASRMEVVLTRGNVHAEDQMAGALAALDLFLRQGSLSGLSQFVAASPVLSKSMQSVNAPGMSRR
ncbi:MAG: hypothetical protein KF865_14380 [Bdellovibrionaceae bacterium]|nr:hypothetical protein [Pseudobdellovibrionaceae bacterium]